MPALPLIPHVSASRVCGSWQTRLPRILPVITSNPAKEARRPFLGLPFPIPSQAHSIHTTPSSFSKKKDIAPLQPTDPSHILSSFDVLSSIPVPSSSIETIYPDGFSLNNGLSIRLASGIFLLHNEAFRWSPIHVAEEDGVTQLLKGGVLELSDDCWGVLDVVWPKPDLLIVGTGAKNLLLQPNSKKKLQDMGVTVDVMDTHNAAAQYNLLATERPRGQVAAALMVMSFGK